MIASSQFSNLQLGILATWQFGKLAIWQLGNLATWQFGNLARNAELTFNFGNFQFLQLSIFATFNFGNFQKIHKKSPYTLYNSYQGKIANFYNFVDRKNPPFSACMDLAIKKESHFYYCHILITLIFKVIVFLKEGPIFNLQF